MTIVFSGMHLDPATKDLHIEVVGEAENGVVAEEMVLKFRPDVIRRIYTCPIWM